MLSIKEDKDKIRANSNKKNLLKIIIIIFVVIIIIGIITYIYITVNKLKAQAEEVNGEITKVLDHTITDAKEIVRIKNMYDSLDKQVKKYVQNKSEFENFKLDITSDNFLDYFDVKVSFSDYECDVTSTLFLNEYRGTSKETIIIQPKANMTCENVVVNLNFNLNGWQNGDLENARLDEKGNYSETKEIVYKTTGFKPFEPSYYEQFLEVLEVSGNISFK